MTAAPLQRDRTVQEEQACTETGRPCSWNGGSSSTGGKKLPLLLWSVLSSELQLVHSDAQHVFKHMRQGFSRSTLDPRQQQLYAE